MDQAATTMSTFAGTSGDGVAAPLAVTAQMSGATMTIVKKSATHARRATVRPAAIAV
jgi:hypothetical protein